MGSRGAGHVVGGDSDTLVFSFCLYFSPVRVLSIEPGFQKETHGRTQVYSVNGGSADVFTRLKGMLSLRCYHMIAVYKSEHCAQASLEFPMWVSYNLYTC